MNDDRNQEAAKLNYEDWSGEMGIRWLTNLDGFERTLAPLGQALLARADLSPGDRVLDIGCGGGATTRAIAEMVGPHGEALGIDISPDLIAAADKRAREAGVANAHFICADASSVEVEGSPRDRLLSRFGSMFFTQPVAAFSNLRKLLKSGGRMDLAVWAPPAENPWMSMGMAVVQRHVDVPTPAPRAPGPFAFENPNYLLEVLENAGFGSIDVVSKRGVLSVGGAGSTASQAQQCACDAMAFGQVLKQHPDTIQRAAQTDLLTLYEGYHRPGEGVMMEYSAWLVSAIA
jgi:SAM-dependent methyltransferase